MGLLILVILIILVLGARPGWNHSADWGNGPSGLLGLVLVVILILILLGHIPVGRF